jgi:hypothetical protein
MVTPDCVTPLDRRCGFRLGIVPLSGKKSITAEVTLPRSGVKQFFDIWKNVNAVRVFYCLQADGLPNDRNEVYSVSLPNVFNNNIAYTAGFDGSLCALAPQAVAITRNELVRSLEDASPDSSDDQTADKTSGNNTSSSSQGNASSMNCVGATCTRRQAGSMGGSGLFGRKFFAADAESSDTSGPNDSGTATSHVQAEALGYQIVDMPDDGSLMWADGPNLPNGFSFNVDLPLADIEAAIDRSLGFSNVEAESGRYGGREGIGIVFGYKTPIQIGPIPGIINIGVGAGISVGFSVKFQFKPDKPYACLNPTGTGKCYRLVRDTHTQTDARAECAKDGGLLAEPRNDTDVNNVLDVAEANQTYWIGGQHAYQYTNSACAEATGAVAQNCVLNSTVSYRWLSDDDEFAKAAGGTALATVTSRYAFLNQWQALLKTTDTDSRLADGAGTVLVKQSRRIIAVDNRNLNQAICEYEPATRERYFKVAGGVGIGAGAGVSLSFCTPSDKIGICLVGAVNFVDLSLGYELSYEKRAITLKSTGQVMNIGGVGQEVPWSITLLSGSISAVFKFFFTSLDVTIVEWGGFKLASGSLFSSYHQIVERP